MKYVLKKGDIINHNRKEWLDALRGLAILLVIYGHSVKGFPLFFVFTSPVKMPLFFAITGYLLYIREEKAFFTQILNRVIIPWLILGILPVVLMIPFKGIGNVFSTLLGMLSGKVLWFFPCFIIGEIIHFVLRKYCKTIWGIVIASFFFFLVGFLAHKHGVLNYAMINRAFTVQPFFLIGYLFRIYESQLTKLRWGLIGGLFVVYIALCSLSIALFPGRTLDVHLNQYFNIPYCFLLVFLGCIVLFTAASKAEIKSSFMSFIGQNTLVLYIWHAYAIAILIKVISFAGWTMPFNWWTALIMVLWACLVCGICAILLNRYLPFFVGKKRLIRTNS